MITRDAGQDRGRWRGRGWAPMLLMTCIALLAGCSSSATTSGTGTATAGATATASATATTAPTATSVGYPVKVYFSKHPASDSDPSKVFAVDRTAPSLAVATYASQQLLAGPTASETTAGYFTPFQGILSGASTCGGADFTITLNMKGSTPATNTATFKFCRVVNVPGEVAGGEMKTELTATLTQFSNIHTAVILTQDGGCFEDLSGMNLCLT
jgi:hypothetical protein